MRSQCGLVVRIVRPPAGGSLLCPPPRCRRTQLPPLLPDALATGAHHEHALGARWELQMPKPRARQLLAGPAGLAEQAAIAAPPAAVKTGSAESDSAPSEPPSPMLRDGHGGGNSDGDFLLGGNGMPASSTAGGFLNGGSAAMCRLAGGPTAEEQAESRRVRRQGCRGCAVAASTRLPGCLAAIALAGMWAVHCCTTVVACPSRPQRAPI